MSVNEKLGVFCRTLDTETSIFVRVPKVVVPMFNVKNPVMTVNGNFHANIKSDRKHRRQGANTFVG